MRTPPLLSGVAGMMILFGVAELFTAFRHNFFGLVDGGRAFTAIGAMLGVCYLASGVLVLMPRRSAARAAVALLVVDVVGRVAIVATGLFPVDDGRQIFGIVVGTLIAAGAAVIVARWSRRLA